MLGVQVESLARIWHVDTFIGTRIWHAYWHVSTQARWHRDHVLKQARMARDLANSVGTIYIKTRYFA